jgi:flagellum-specific ATP synthase
VIVIGLIDARGREVKEFIEQILGEDGLARSDDGFAAPLRDGTARDCAGHRRAARDAKGYPLWVFAKLPALVERTGNGPEGGGSITAFYTVLTEGDDQQDPIADSARAILDGHVVPSRALAEAGHYPAIDIEASISRAMTALISDAHLDRTRQFKQMLSR